MCHATRIVKDRQLAVRREMDRRGKSLQILASDSGIPYPTICSYFPANRDANPAMIPMAVVFAIADSGALPVDVLSMLLPDSMQLVSVPEGICHDGLAANIHDYLQTKSAAHHPDSEAGPAIGPGEKQVLDSKAVKISVVAA